MELSKRMEEKDRTDKLGNDDTAAEDQKSVTGGSQLSRTVVKLDYRLTWILCPKKFCIICIL